MTSLRIRAALRQATASAHAALDERWSATDLATPSGYRAFLAAIAAALLPSEAALAAAQVETVLPDWPARARSTALLDDLAGLGLEPPPCDALVLRPGPSLFGTLYVLEGSRLGGALLLRDAEASTDSAVRSNTRFLRHGQGAGLWRSFLLRLDAQDPADLPAIVAAANATFIRFAAASRVPARQLDEADAD